MVNKIVGFLEAILRLFRAAENLLVDIAAAAAPWLAPLPSAYLTYSHMLGVLGFPEWIAIGAAVCIELLGLSSVQTAFSLWQYNTERRQIDRAAPVLVAVLTGAAYLAVVLLLVLALDDAPPQVKAARAGLASLAVIGAVVLALRANHARRLAAIQAERERQRAERAAAKVGNYGNSENAANGRELPRNAEELPQMAAKRPYNARQRLDPASVWSMTSEEVAEKYGVSDRTARDWRSRAWKKLQETEGNNG
jgi:hypothetical protein